MTSSPNASPSTPINDALFDTTACLNCGAALTGLFCAILVASTWRMVKRASSRDATSLAPLQ